MNTREFIHTKVNNLYEEVPYPLWDHKKRVSKLPNEILRYKYLNIDHVLENANVLDVGCGTGNRSILAAKYFKVKKLYGFDACKKSLEIASKVAKEENFDNFIPIHGDLFNLPFDDNFFDVVISWGVLHHTYNPKLGLKEMHRVCKYDGYIGFFVYNSFADWRHNLQRKDVLSNGGKTTEEKLSYALKHYGKTNKYKGLKKIEDFSQELLTEFRDEFIHPHKSDHTINEILDWQKELSIEFSGSFPPMRFRDTISWIKDRYQMRKKYPISKSKLVNLVGFISSLFPRRKLFCKLPSKFHIVLWHLFYFLQGADGSFSHGPVIAGKKTRNNY